MSILTHRTRSAGLAGLGAAAALSLLVACGGGSGGGQDSAGKDKDNGVASINSPSASAGAASASATGESGRPQLRLDTSKEEAARLTQIFFDCLHEHGVPGGRKPGSTKISVDADIRKYPAAYKACTSKWPLQPPEEDPAKNPHYLDDFRTYIKCLNHGGLKVKGLSDGSGWTYESTPTLTGTQIDELDHDCTLKAYS